MVDLRGYREVARFLNYHVRAIHRATIVHIVQLGWDEILIGKFMAILS